ncbi:MAG: envelope stress response membrane protein PspC [Rhodothalassiaceae bacterium]
MTRIDRNRLYKDSRNGVFMGVCAGLADYMNVKPLLVRLVLVLCALAWFPILIPIYFIAGLALDDKPRDLYRDPQEEEFWKTARSRPDVTAASMRQRFRDIDRRMQRLERLLTSKRFRLERELKDLEG